MNSTKSELEKPVLLTQLMSLIEKCQVAYGQKRVFNRSLALVMAELFAFGRLVGLVMATVGIRSGPPPDEKRFGVRRKTMLERQGHHSQCAMVCMRLRPDAVGGLSGLGQRRGAATAWIVAENTPALVFQHLMAWFSYRNVATTSIPRHLDLVPGQLAEK